MTQTLMPPKVQNAYNVNAIRQDFPILSQVVNGHPLVYLDNGATTQKPQQVIDTISQFYAHEYGTVRRGVYALSVKSTQMFDDVREKTAKLINASKSDEIIFVRGTTEAMNLLAYSFARPKLKAGQNIVISATEHHANIVPWQQLCLEKDAELRIIPVLDSGDLDLDAFEKLMDDKTCLVSVGHVSNVLGTIHPIRQMADLAHAKGIPILVDGAQGAPHLPVDVQALDCDFYAFSSHKLYGPTGVGVLYGKYNLLLEMPPYQCGGDMIETVTFEKTTFALPPKRFEAGTPSIAQVIGLGAAIDYINQVGIEAIETHENNLLAYATAQLQEKVEGLTIIGQAKNKTSLISFTIKGVHPHDIGTLLDEKGIAVRAGHHCAQPLMKRYGVSATTRASFAAYNTPTEVDALVQGLVEIQKLFN